MRRDTESNLGVISATLQHMGMARNSARQLQDRNPPLEEIQQQQQQHQQQQQQQDDIEEWRHGRNQEMEEEIDREEERLYRVNRSARINVRKFNTVGQDLHIRVKDVHFTEEFDEVLRVLYKVFEQIIRDYIEPLPDNSYVRLVLNSDDLDTPISLRFQQKNLITPEAIFTAIRNVVQSRRLFVIDDDLRINMIYTTLPEGRGPKKNGLRTKDSRSIIQVCNGETDYLCLANSVVMGRGIADDRDKAYMWRLKRRGGFMQKESIALLEEVGIAVEDRAYSLKDVERMQSRLTGYQFIVIEKDMTNEVLYMGPYAEKKIVILHENHHYDAVRNINKFLPEKQKLCFYCGRVYDQRYPHYSCMNMCKLCTGKDCDSDKKIDAQTFDWQHCLGCKRMFVSKKCHDNHLLDFGGGSMCDRIKKCAECKVNVEAKKLHPPEKHKCGVKRCKICKKSVSTSIEHLCFVQPYEKEEENDKGTAREVFYYDIETTTDEHGRHIPILLVFQSEDGATEKVFRGEDCVKEFGWEILASNAYKNSIFLAHNAGKFDNYFITRFLLQEGYKLNIVHNGGSVMFFTIRKFNITFKDTLMFLPKRLADLPKMFSIENQVCKGYFPYLYPYPGKGENYTGEYPDPKYFNIDNMKESARKDFMKWWEEKREGGEIFDFQHELERYCINDVLVLRLCVEEFRKMFSELGEVDPILESYTLTHACSLVYRKKYLEPETMGIIPPWGYKSAKQYSRIGIVWLEYMSKKMKKHIRHARNGGEVCILNRYYVDGFIPPTIEQKVKGLKGTVLEMNGCRSHGCPDCYQGKTLEPQSGKTMGKLFDQYLSRKISLKTAGYDFIEIWEHDYMALLKSDPLLKEINANLNMRDPIKPRDAFHGGRTEVFRLYMEAGENETIKQLDFKSLYPHVQRSPDNFYPIGHPDIILSPKVEDLDKYFGLVKAKILPPKKLDIPVLSYTTENEPKLMFTLCRTCAENRQTTKCKHTVNQRSWEGTFVSPELNVAMSKGYRVLEVYEIWNWPEDRRSNTLFRDYMSNFLKIKIAASGFPEGCETYEQKQEYVKFISEKEDISLNVEDIVPNKGLKAVGKAIITSLWGKMAQRLDKEKTEYVTSPQQYYKMIIDDRYDITTLNIVSENMLEVGHKTPEELCDPHPFVNHVLASFVTSYGRIHLYKEMSKIKIENLAYCDTDCIVFRTYPGAIDLETGVSLGTLSCEIYGNHGLVDSIGTWVALAPKTYAYRLKNNSHICVVKCKGITLNFTTAKKVNIESMIKLLKTDTDKAINVCLNHQMERRKAQKFIYSKSIEKELSFTFDKRVVLDTVSYSTLPYGHTGIQDGTDEGTRQWQEKVKQNKERKEVKKGLNRYQNQQLLKENV